MQTAMPVLLQAFASTTHRPPADTEVRPSARPPADTEMRPCAATDVRLVLAMRPHEEEVMVQGRLVAPPRPPGPPPLLEAPAIVEWNDLTEVQQQERVRLELLDSMRDPHVRSDQEALPLFPPLMVIPAAANCALPPLRLCAPSNDCFLPCISHLLSELTITYIATTTYSYSLLFTLWLKYFKVN